MKIAERVAPLIAEDLANQPAVAKASAAIVNFIDAHSENDLSHLTYGMLTAEAHADREIVWLAIQYLTGARACVLQTKFVFSDEDDLIDIDDAAVADAERQKVFYHPVTGEPVDNFEEKIFVYFCPRLGSSTP